MTDMELAKLLGVDLELPPWCCNLECNSECDMCALQWLKEEVSVDDGTGIWGSACLRQRDY